MTSRGGCLPPACGPGGAGSGQAIAKVRAREAGCAWWILEAWRAASPGVVAARAETEARAATGKDGSSSLTTRFAGSAVAVPGCKATETDTAWRWELQRVSCSGGCGTLN